MGMGQEEDEEMTELCTRLDGLVLKVMEDLEMLQQKRETFNSLIEEGWFSLSKSRYAMGNKFVSTTQYGHTMAPLVHVYTSILEHGGTSFQMERRESGDVANRENRIEGSLEVEDIGPADQAVRRRNVALKKDVKERPLSSKDEPMQQPGIPDKEVTKCIMQTEGQPSPSQDPLKWFGILVPQSLRQAQTSFKKVIELAADIATLQSRLEVMQNEYRTLIQQKQQNLTKESI